MSKIPTRNIIVGLNASEPTGPSRKESPPPSTDGCLTILGVLIIFFVVGKLVDIFGNGAIIFSLFVLFILIVYIIYRNKRKDHQTTQNTEKFENFNNILNNNEQNSVPSPKITPHSAEKDQIFNEIREEIKTEQVEKEEILKEEQRLRIYATKMDEKRKAKEIYDEYRLFLEIEEEEKAAGKQWYDSTEEAITCDGLCSDCNREKCVFEE